MKGKSTGLWKGWWRAWRREWGRIKEEEREKWGRGAAFLLSPTFHLPHTVSALTWFVSPEASIFYCQLNAKSVRCAGLGIMHGRVSLSLQILDGSYLLSLFDGICDRGRESYDEFALYLFLCCYCMFWVIDVMIIIIIIMIIIIIDVIDDDYEVSCSWCHKRYNKWKISVSLCLTIFLLVPFRPVLPSSFSLSSPPFFLLYYYIHPRPPLKIKSFHHLF